MQQSKYPVSIQTSSEIIKGGYVYIDKTDLDSSMVKDGFALKFYCAILKDDIATAMDEMKVKGTA